MPMPICVLALLVELDCQVCPEQIAVSFDQDARLVEAWAQELVDMGYAKRSGNYFEASEAGRDAIMQISEDSPIAA